MNHGRGKNIEKRSKCSKQLKKSISRALVAIIIREKTRGVLPILAFTGRLRPKGVPFSGFRYIKG